MSVLELVASAQRIVDDAKKKVPKLTTDATDNLNKAEAALAQAQKKAEALARAEKSSADKKTRDRLRQETTDAARLALRLGYDAVSTAGIGPSFADKKDEWKECRSTIDRFDKILVDLRKTGFSFITALVSAAAFIFSRATPDPASLDAKLSILCMLVLLVVTVYSVDRVHQAWLQIAVARAVELEEQLDFELTRKIGSNFRLVHATAVGLSLYVMLLVATCVIFWFTIPDSEPILGGHRMTLYGAGATGIIIMSFVGFAPEVRNGAAWSRSHPRLSSLILAAFLLVIVVGYASGRHFGWIG